MRLRLIQTGEAESKTPTTAATGAGVNQSRFDKQETSYTDHDAPAIRKWTVSADLLVEVLA